MPNKLIKVIMRIEKITGREILDSRGNPTVEVDVFDGEAYSPLIPPQVEMKRKKAEVLV